MNLEQIKEILQSTHTRMIAEDEAIFNTINKLYQEKDKDGNSLLIEMLKDKEYDLSPVYKACMNIFALQCIMKSLTVRSMQNQSIISPGEGPSSLSL